MARGKRSEYRTINAAQIKRNIKRAGLTQDAAAAKIGISKGTLSNALTTGRMHIDTQRALAVLVSSIIEAPVLRTGTSVSGNGIPKGAWIVATTNDEPSTVRVSFICPVENLAKLILAAQKLGGEILGVTK